MAVDAVRGQRLFDDASSVFGDFEDLVALHDDAHAVVCSCVKPTETPTDSQQFLVGTVSVNMTKNARFFGRLEHDCAGAIAEQYAGGAIRPVDHARGVSAPTTGAVFAARADELVGDGQRIDGRAGGVDIERGAAVCPEPVCSRQAVDGKIRSGVVPTMSRSFFRSDASGFERAWRH